MRYGTLGLMCGAALIAGQTAAWAIIDQQPETAATVPSAVATQPDPELVVLERQLVMQQLEKDVKALGAIVSGKSSPDKLDVHAKSIAQGAKDALKAFEPNVPGGGAKPEIWTHWDDFSKQMADFASKTDEMAKASETGDVQAVAALMSGALPCKQCHDLYRTKDEHHHATPG